MLQEIDRESVLGKLFPEEADQEVSQGAARVGKVEETPGRTVVLESRIGGNRVVDMLSGEQLPRIC